MGPIRFKITKFNLDMTKWFGIINLGFFLKYLNERLGNYCRIIEFDDRDILESLKAKLFWSMILDGQMGFFYF